MNKVDMIPVAQTSAPTPAPETGKFAHPDYTADGQREPPFLWNG